ncbi:MAG: class I SAM-dependent methyltransferase, partial [Acidimicrobiia bacterium]
LLNGRESPPRDRLVCRLAVSAGPAARRWRHELETWEIPSELLEAVPDSPYTFSPKLWKRRGMDIGENPTSIRVTALAGRGGSILDVGAGMGRASLALARAGHPVTAVERNQAMLAGLREASAGFLVKVVEGSWPEVAETVGPHEVALSAHVVYDVAEIGPFLAALVDRAAKGVVIELAESHPWTHLGPYYRRLHGLVRPTGPNVDDLAAVVREVCGIEPNVERWSRPSDLWFESLEEIFELYGRRLVLPPNRWTELADLLKPEINESGGRLRVGNDDTKLATVWWAPTG